MPNSSGELHFSIFVCRQCGPESRTEMDGIGWGWLRTAYPAIGPIGTGARQHFVHSKVIAWVAFDRAANQFAAEGSIEAARHWRAIADEVHAEVCERGFDRDLNSFVQAFCSKRLDADLLLIPLVGFLPATDPRVRNMVRAIEERLLIQDEFVLRYE